MNQQIIEEFDTTKYFNSHLVHKGWLQLEDTIGEGTTL